MHIKKNQLIIRSAKEADAEDLTRWWNDGKVMAHAGFPNGLNQSLEITLNQIKRNDVGFSQLCILEADGHSIGEMNYHLASDTAEIGIKICEMDYQNQGIGTTFLGMLIEYLFEDQALNQENRINRIILDTNVLNERAQSIYEKLGFRKIRLNQDAWVDQLGVKQSSIDYALTREQYENGVRYISDEIQKSEITANILENLPDWFGVEDSRNEYIQHSKTMPFWAFYKNNEAVGFIVLQETSPYAAEIYVMGINKQFHRMGIGKQLFQALYTYAKQHSYEFLQVKTVDEGYYDDYDRTRLFYEHLGFKKLACFPTLWDEHNPCLLMILAIQ